MAHETFRCEFVKCGKAGCKKCPHGPYWYAYWREGKRLRKRYVGKSLPSSDAAAPPRSRSHPWDVIFDGRKATLILACNILGFQNGCTLDEARAAFRRLVWEHHPDRGNDNGFIRHYNAAWEYVRNHYAWEETDLG